MMQTLTPPAKWVVHRLCSLLLMVLLFASYNYLEMIEEFLKFIYFNSGKRKAAEKLITGRCNISATDSNGETALFYAAAMGNYKCFSTYAILLS